MDDPNSLPFRGGELIAGKYRVDAVLGAGGMGVVLAATHLDLDRKVAVKVIRPELTSDEALVERLLLEARAAARIKGEHVGKVLDVARLPNGAPYIVMEFLEGRDLGVLLERDGPLPVSAAVDLLLQACEAIAEAHAAQIVHRDLKPENLFILTQPDGALWMKVLDFGISKQLGDPGRRALTNPTTAVGSPQYMAPEQMRAEDIDTRVDVWALGAILYEMLSGQKAFDAETLPAICARVLSDPPKPLREHKPELSPLLEQIVHRCLSKQRERRYDSVAALSEALAPFGSSQADLSCRRIRALSQYVSRVPAELAETVLAAERVSIDGTAKGVSRTIAGQTAGTEESEPSPRKLPLWPVYLGATAAIGLAIFLWNWSRIPPERAREAVTLRGGQNADPTSAQGSAAASSGVTAAAQGVDPAASATAPLTPPLPLAGAGTALVGPGASSVAPEASNSAAASTVPPVDPKSEPSAKPPAQVRAGGAKPGTGANPKPTTPAPSTGDAWDPDNFGSRH